RLRAPGPPPASPRRALRPSPHPHPADRAARAGPGLPGPGAGRAVATRRRRRRGPTSRAAARARGPRDPSRRAGRPRHRVRRAVGPADLARRPRGADLHSRKDPVMRIAYTLLDPGIGVFGTKGAAVHVQEVIRALRADGHQVTVFCTRTNDDVPADLADLE